jgi:hypothetical protein
MNAASMRNSHQCPTETPHYFDKRPFVRGAKVSMGIGKIVMEFFSAAIPISVWREWS